MADPETRDRRQRPLQGDGKAERFIKTLLDEWAYARPDHTNAERTGDLPAWLDFYNHWRPHTAIEGLVPYAALVNNLDVNHN